MNAFFEYRDETQGESHYSSHYGTHRGMYRNRLPIEAFYDQLRKEHESDDLETGIPTNVQHPALRPILRPYQQKGIKWMLKRELRTEHLTQLADKIRSKFNPSQTFYFDHITQLIYDQPPEGFTIPAGGMLTGKPKHTI